MLLTRWDGDDYPIYHTLIALPHQADQQINKAVREGWELVSTSLSDQKILITLIKYK